MAGKGMGDYGDDHAAIRNGDGRSQSFHSGRGHSGPGMMGPNGKSVMEAKKQRKEYEPTILTIPLSIIPFIVSKEMLNC